MLITPEEALEIVLSNVRPLKARQVALGEALHCRLAEAICSDRDQPPTDRSSMDGYAVRTADLRKVPARLRLVAEVAAGSAVRVGVQNALRTIRDVADCRRFHSGMASGRQVGKVSPEQGLLSWAARRWRRIVCCGNAEVRRLVVCRWRL
jgi:hypothetical protein